MSASRNPLLAVPAAVAGAVLNLVDVPMRALQRVLGVPRIGWMFVAPNLLILGLFTFLPIVINFYFAFSGGVELYPSQRPFTGLDNLETLFDCGNYLDPSTCRQDIFWRAIYNTAFFAVVQVGLMVSFALITALVLNRKIIGRGFFRGVFFYPVLLSPVVVALIWKWMLQREGVLNALMVAAGAAPVQWLTQGHWAFFWSVFVSIWAHMGFYTLILLAGLQAIPGEQYEAARLDGAGPWAVFRHITLPSLGPMLLMVSIITMAAHFQLFAEPYVMTQGGPAQRTVTVLYLMYEEGFKWWSLGTGSAVAFVLFLFMFGFTVLQVQASRRWGTA